MSEQENNDMGQYFFRASANDFYKVPGNPIAYWISDKERDSYQDGGLLGTFFSPRKGMDTGENATFLRFWHEVSSQDTAKNHQEENTQKTWFPYNKGGDYRKWYGNREYVVNWKNDGTEIKSRLSWKKKKPTLRNTDYFFKEGFTWTTVSSSSFSARYTPPGSIFDNGGCTLFADKNLDLAGALINSKVASRYLEFLSPTLNFQPGNIGKILFLNDFLKIESECKSIVKIAKTDWDSYETSWDFTSLPLSYHGFKKLTLQQSYQALRIHWLEQTNAMQRLEEENNRIFIEAYGLQDELTPDVPLKEITLTCNPHYRYGGERTDEELETLLQCDTIKELVSYAIGCMMGRYSLDKSGLILASQDETLDDYYRQIPVASFAPDDDGILPLNDQEWFADDATNRVREFVRVVWGEDKLRENLDFIAESLCLHAIKAKKGEDSLDCIRRYLSTQFFKDHMRMYKNRPIYWLFSSGKHKAFECLVYLHRYNEGTLARMRTEYLIPLSAKLHSYAEKLEQDKEASTSAAEIKSLEKQITDLHNQQAELAEYDEQLRHYADQRIQLDLDDGVKINYGKFGTLLAEVKKIAG